MKKSITYRQAAEADTDTVTGLLYLLYNGEGLDLSREELPAENRRLFADENQAFWLAFDRDRPVGVSHGSKGGKQVC